MALTKVRGGGVDNPLTLGGGAASDRSIIFDGNAQDFHIGLDDSADSLTIGLGSTLGTTSHMVFDANGRITKPLQPAFSVTNTGSSQSITHSTLTTVTYDTERFDQGSNFASNTFTAPVTGKYQLSINIPVNNLDNSASFYYGEIATSNRRYLSMFDMGSFSNDFDYKGFVLSLLVDMDANDTAQAKIYQQAGATQSAINNDAEFNHFTGYLVC